MSLLTNLISYWKLDEASGNALDAHGANPLAQAGSVGTAAGKISTARDFPGGGAHYFSHASNADLATGDVDFTFACWFRADAFTNYPPLGTKEVAPSSNPEWQVYVDSSSFRLSMAVQSNSVLATWGTAVSTGVWHHVVGWHDSVNNQVGVSVDNGTPVLTSHAGGVTAGTGPFLLGAWPLYSRWWDGRVDEAGFWKRVLTAQERADLYNGGAGFAYPFTVVLPDTTVPSLSFPGVVGSFPGITFSGGAA